MINHCGKDLARFRFRVAAVLLLLGTWSARPGHAQVLDPQLFSGVVTVTQPLTRGMPGNLAGRLIVEPSRQGLAPWGSFGFRWGGLSERAESETYPIGQLGIRLHRRSLRVALSLSRDIAYDRLGQPARAPTTPLPPVPDTMLWSRTDGLELLADSGGAEPPRYVLQPVTDVLGSAAWTVSRMTLGFEAGWRIAGPGRARPWFSATVAAPLVAPLALVAGIDQRHDRFAPRAAPRLTLGLEWRAAPWGRRSTSKPRVTSRDSSARARPALDAAVSVRRMPNGIDFHFAAPAASKVEVRSDLTYWTAMPLRRDVDGTWHVELAAEPGVHRLAIRVDDGPWLPPPGLPVGSDGYGALVGLLILDPQ